MRCWWCFIYKCCDIAASLAACLVSLSCAVAGLFPVAFPALFPYSMRNGQSAPRIGGRVAAGGVSVRVGVSFVAGGAAYPPHPQTENAKSGLPSQKIFSKKYFFYFCITIIHQPVGVVSSFAGFFRVKWAYFRCFS